MRSRLYRTIYPRSCVAPEFAYAVVVTAVVIIAARLGHLPERIKGDEDAKGAGAP